jgi:hypothetical protein
MMASGPFRIHAGPPAIFGNVERKVAKPRSWGATPGGVESIDFSALDGDSARRGFELLTSMGVDQVAIEDRDWDQVKLAGPNGLFPRFSFDFVVVNSERRTPYAMTRAFYLHG